MYWDKMYLCKTAQENLMNAPGEFVYSMLCLIKPKNITTIITTYVDNHLIIISGKHSKRQYCWTENKEQY
jgi:hypothetical protein